jgi:hypothetical protein
LDQQQDGGSGVGSADAELVEAPVDPEGDLAVGVDAVAPDAVAPDAVVGVVVAACFGGGFGMGAQPLLQRLMEPLDLATGGGLWVSSPSRVR